MTRDLSKALRGVRRGRSPRRADPALIVELLVIAIGMSIAMASIVLWMQRRREARG